MVVAHADRGGVAYPSWRHRPSFEGRISYITAMTTVDYRELAMTWLTKFAASLDAGAIGR
jgi:hypothetical protein